MNKISIIIQREYLSKVKKKSFLVMTLIAPVLMAALIIAPVLLTNYNDQEEKKIAVFDNSGSFKETIKNSDRFKFEFIKNDEIKSYKENLSKLPFDILLQIPKNPENKQIVMFSEKQPSVNVKLYISSVLEKELNSRRLKALGISDQMLGEATKSISLKTVKITETGKEETGSSELSLAVGFVLAIIIYMFIFIYGAQVMRSVIEEKTSRIVEIIVSSVKPFELMSGKIIGIALVALTQFALWGILTGIIIGIFFVGFDFDPASAMQTGQTSEIMLEQGFHGNTLVNSPAGDMLQAVFNMNWLSLIGSFIFFFIFGYLLYASLFASIGSAVDNETDSQQFTLPVTIPLILAFVAAQTIVEQPDGQIAFWFSIIPFTSPIIMPVRVALEAVSVWEMILSGILLIFAVIGTIGLAGKIYRTGILMYGKKVNYKEILKWVRIKG